MKKVLQKLKIFLSIKRLEVLEKHFNHLAVWSFNA